jgi:2-haloacid dehalogenase
VQSYKPSPNHFRRALDLVAGERSRLLHMAQSHYHDLRAAVPLGIPVVWVNRHDDALPQGGAKPTAEVRSIAEAIAWLSRTGAE